MNDDAVHHPLSRLLASHKDVAARLENVETGTIRRSYLGCEVVYLKSINVRNRRSRTNDI